MTEELDADAARRVLRRAHEIAAEHDLVEDEGSSGVSGQALVEAATEVGIDADSVRDALALERFDAERPESQAFDGVGGRGSIPVEHVVSRTVAAALDDAEAWFTIAHRMRCIRTPDGGLECRPRAGITARVGRSVQGAASDDTIKAVDRITVTAQALTVGATVDQPRTLLRFVADRRRARRRRLGVGSASGVAAVGAGVASAGALGSVALGSVVAVPILVGGYAVVRTGSRHADHVELELIHVLTAVDRGDRPVGLVGRAARRARRVATGRHD